MASQTEIEAAKTRIQHVVEQIAKLSKSDIASEEFFKQFLELAISATDGKGGAIWLCDTKGQDQKRDFQLCAQVRFETSLFHSDEAQRAVISKVLQETVRARRALILAPESSRAVMTTAQQPPANKTPFPFIHVPLLLKQEIIGVFQVWLMPYVPAESYTEFANFLTSLIGYVEQHLQSRQLGNLVLENQRLQHLLKYSNDIAGSLDLFEVAKLTANYGRDLVGCERCVVLQVENDAWKALAISGQETVEKKSTMVKAMVAFVKTHCGAESQVFSKKELIGDESSEDAAAALTREVDVTDLNYFQQSRVLSAMICPILDSEKKIVGALLYESTFDHYFTGNRGNAAPIAKRVAEWVTVHGGRGLMAAYDYKTLPFLTVTKRIRHGRLLLTGEKRKRTLLRWWAIAGVILLISLWPVNVKVEGNCSVIPIDRAVIVPEIPGRIEKVMKREGDSIKKGEAIAQMDTQRLQTELETVVQEKLRYQAEADRYRAPGLSRESDEASAQIATRQAAIAAENEKRILKDIKNATLKSPLDGIVLTKHLELRSGEFIQAGAPFAEVANLDSWELQIEVSEKDIGRVEDAMRKKQQLPINYALYSESASVLESQLTSTQQISTAAYPREKDTVFIVTVQNPEIPGDIKKNLRPGLTGRAKIKTTRQPFIWKVISSIKRWVEMRFI